MKLLVLSDSHYENDVLNAITIHYPNMDYYIHCGDSSLDKEDPLLKNYIVIKGNHDDAMFSKYEIIQVQGKRVLITHGHYYHVYRGYEELTKLAKEHQIDIVLHGHTHVPTHQVIEGIHFINPGSIMINRGSYGFGSYCIIDINESFQVHFYHHITHENVDFILPEGLELLNEFKHYAI